MKFSEALNEWFELSKKIDGMTFHDYLEQDKWFQRKTELEEIMDNMIHADDEDDHH